MRLILLAMLVSLSACTALEPWERGHLAREEMAFEPDPLAARLDGQVYFSKEASSSNTATSGGGCGCN